MARGCPSEPRRMLPARQGSPENIREDDGVVVLGVPGRVDERQRPAPRSPPQLREPRAVAAQLLEVATAELFEAVRVVAEPPPQAGARGELLLPPVEPGTFAGDPARPEPIDQDAVAVRVVRRLI